MDNMTQIRLELGINAQQFTQQIMLNNKTIEEQIKKGIELALNDIGTSEDLIQGIREQTKTQLSNIVNQHIMTYEIREKIRVAINNKIGEKIEEYAEKMSDAMMKQIK